MSNRVKIEAFANNIALFVNSVEDVNFDTGSAGSLVTKVRIYYNKLFVSRKGNRFCAFRNILHYGSCIFSMRIFPQTPLFFRRKKITSPKKKKKNRFIRNVRIQSAGRNNFFSSN